MRPKGFGFETARDDLLERLVYIVGPARGGTSVLNRTLGAHPRHLFTTNVSYVLERVWRVAGRVPAAELRRRFEALPSNPCRAVLERLPAARRVPLEQALAAAFAAPRLDRLFQLVPLVTLLAASHGKEVGDLACWQAKSNNWRGLEALRKVFPKAVFVLVFRDPRSAALSGGLRASRKRHGGAGDGRIDLAELVDYCLYWRTMTLMCLRFQRRHPEAAVGVRFEDFVVDPMAELNRVFARTVADPLAGEAAARLVAAVEGGATNAPAERYRGVSRAPLERWKDRLAADELDVIAAVTGRAARAAGYDVPPPVAEPGILRLVGAVPEPGRRLRVAAKILALGAYERLALPRA